MLTGKEILKQIEEGNITFEPKPEAGSIGPNSIDCHLGRYLLTPKKGLIVKLNGKVKESSFIKIDLANYPEGFTMQPLTLYLGSTAERVGSDLYVPEMHNRSSIARKGCAPIIGKAGLGDLGFKNDWTLEFICLLPTVVKEGDKVAQFTFEPVQVRS